MIHNYLQEWVKISDLPTNSVEDSAEPPENPILAWLREKGIKTWETIISECKKQVDSKKGEDKDEADKASDKKDESECKEQAKSKEGGKNDTDQKIETGDKKNIKEETDDHVRCYNVPYLYIHLILKI